MEKVLVTGAAGFIGSHLVDQLLERGHEVIGIDNLSTGTLDNLSKNTDNDSFRFVKTDIRQGGALRKLMRDEDIKAVFHEAALASVPRSFRDPCKTNEVNVSGTIDVLEASKSAEVAKVILASSAAVYGKPKYLPYDEKHPTNPVSPYGTSKRAAELYCETFNRVYGLDTVILRYFNVYGPRQKYSRECSAMATFVNRALRGKPLPIFGDGNQTRDFVYVTDVVDANLRALQTKRATEKTFNIASGTAVSINKLAKIVLRMAHKNNVPIVHKQPRQGEARHGYADIKKARKVLGFNPSVALSDGIRMTLEVQDRSR